MWLLLKRICSEFARPLIWDYTETAEERTELFGLGELVVQPEVVQVSELNAAAESVLKKLRKG